MSGASDRSGASNKPASARQLLRQQRELEEKRKFGLAPLAIDTVSGQEISPNIPQSIARAPWYYGASGPTLDHQRKHDERNTGSGAGGTRLYETLREDVDEVVVLGKASRFTAGACRNCGSRTHKTSECTQAKKKVAAKYTNKVTGEDILVKHAVRTDGQKRDRLLGDVGVDFLQALRDGTHDDSGDADMSAEGYGAYAGSSAKKSSSATATESNGVAKKPRVEDVFGIRTAQHGAVEIQELPKYLQNIEQGGDDVFYDPKTGSMRGNPNAHDPTRAFQGDLERYRSGDFYNYVEAQHRYLTGQSKSFVDFSLDRELNAAQGIEVVSEKDGEGVVSGQAVMNVGHTGPATTTSTASGASAHDVLVRALYGETTTSVGERPRLDAPIAVNSTSATSANTAETSTAVSTAANDAAVHAVHERLLQLSRRGAQAAEDAGHVASYGSYLDPVSMQWGYACCKKTCRDAAGCVG